MPESRGIRRNLKLAVKRLNAIEKDLDARLQGKTSQDAVGEMRQACYQMLPHPEQGRFTDEPSAPQASPRA